MVGGQSLVIYRMVILTGVNGQLQAEDHPTSLTVYVHCMQALCAGIVCADCVPKRL